MKIAILSTGDPGKTYTYLWKIIENYGGTMERITDHEAFFRLIVVSAKDLTDAERGKLQGNIEALYQKGALQPRSFIDQVVEVLEHKNHQSHKEDGRDAS